MQLAFSGFHCDRRSGRHSEHLVHFEQMLLLGRAQVGKHDSQRAAGNVLSPRQVEDFALIFQEIEFSRPVTAHDENIYVVQCDVVPLLLPAGFGKRCIHAAQRADDLNSLAELDKGSLALDGIELVGRDAHNEGITQIPRPLQKTEMTDVKQIKGAVSEDDFRQVTFCYDDSTIN